MTAQNPPPVDQTLPKGFEPLGAPLGVGSTAVVWLARRVVDGREFALKVWRHPFADSQERERFLREVHQHVSLNQVTGHLVTYAWAEPDDDLPWIAAEPHGQSLLHLLERGLPPPHEGAVLCSDLLVGLSTMHSRGLIHRDVKPANVLVHDGRAKLCDFGLVMDVASFTLDNAAGSPRYVAPELLRGEGRPSRRTDVYSAAATMRDVLGREAPSQLTQLLTEATSANPQDRPADASEFADRFRLACQALHYELPPPLPAKNVELIPTLKNRTRRTAVIASVVVVMVLVIAGVTRLLTHTDRAHTPTGQSPAAAKSATQPNAAQASPDINANGGPVVLAAATSGRCNQAAPGAVRIREHPFVTGATRLAMLDIYYSKRGGAACAKLIKPIGSPYRGVKTHLALTLCGDGNQCDYDWHSYATDAGPAEVPSAHGCISWRVSMLDPSGHSWLIRDVVGQTSCS